MGSYKDSMAIIWAYMAMYGWILPYIVNCCIFQLNICFFRLTNGLNLLINIKNWEWLLTLFSGNYWHSQKFWISGHVTDHYSWLWLPCFCRPIWINSRKIPNHFSKHYLQNLENQKRWKWRLANISKIENLQFWELVIFEVF